MKKKLVLIAVPAIAAIAAAGYFMSMNGAVEVNASKAAKGDISEYVEELGEISIRDSLGIYSPVGGEVVEVLVESGDVVNEGDVLLRMDGEQASRQLAELDAQVVAVQAQLNEARRAGDKNSIASLELDIADLSAKIVEDESKHINLKTLYDAGAISQEELRGSERALESQKLTLQKLRLQLNQLRSPVSVNIVAQYEAQLKQLQIQREALVDLKGDFEIKAGIAGTVMDVQTVRGSYLQPGMEIMVIGDMSKLYIETDVLVGDIAGIEVGSKVEIGSKDLGITDLMGKVSKVYPNAFSKVSDLGIEQKRIKVEIDIAGSTDTLRPGYDMNLKIILKESKDTLVVPENAVFKLEGKTYVFVDDNGKAALREVQTGLESGRKIEILSGLTEGEMIIESPGSELEEGKKIKLTIDN